MSRKRERSEALETLHHIENNQEQYFFIHYSCESFYETNNTRSPRITAIAIKNIQTGQIESFSILKTAEEIGISANNISEEYDKIEKVMLESYFKFLDKHREMKYLHINMRDDNYGFKAIEHRYKVLKGKPFCVLDSKKVDFALLLKKLFGYNYIEHPRMENLYKYNEIQSPYYLSGKEEAEAFKNQEYGKLIQSTLAKVEVFSTLLNKTINNQLKTKAKKKDIYGISIQAFYEYCKEKWWINLLWDAFLLIAGTLLGAAIS